MATRFWVGGTGTWDASTTTNWSTGTGGAGGASAPTSADGVIFDASSNVGTGTFTVTVTVAVCKTFSTGGAGGALDGTMTLAMGTSTLDIYGNMTVPATNFAYSGTGTITFKATAIGNTFTPNTVSIPSAITFNGVGGEWTLGSALTTTGVVTVISGSFLTGNFNISAASVQSTGALTRAVNLGTSTLSLSGAGPWAVTGSNTTLTATSSTINCSANAPQFQGGDQTYNNVSFTGVSSFGATLNNANTFNNFTIASPTAGLKQLIVDGSNTIKGTLTIGATSTASRRIFVRSGTLGTQRSFILDGASSAIALSDVDFRDIVISTINSSPVSLPVTGTRLGDGKNTSGITFEVAKIVYWNLAGSQNWSAVGWAATNNGAPAVANFPLPQDTATFTEAGTAGTVTLDFSWNIGSIQMADGVSNRATAMTLATGTVTPQIYGSITLYSGLTFTGSGIITFAGVGVTQTITSASKTFTQPITMDNKTGTIQLQDTLTLGATLTTILTSGTLNLNNNTLSTGLFASTNANTRVIAFGTGNITTTGVGTVWNTASNTGLSYTGTPTVNISNNSATATTVSTGAMTQAQSLNFNYTTGTYTLTDTSAVYKSVNFTGFSGTIPNATRIIYGGATFSAGMTLTAGANVTTFSATSGTYNITTAAKTLDFPIAIWGLGGTFVFQDALTQGATRAFTFTAGTVKLKQGVTSTTGVFTTSGSTQKYLYSATPGTLATLTQASGTVNASYLTIKDIAAIGGATWNALWSNNNVDAGDNSGWFFGDPPIINAVEYTYAIRSFTQPRRF